MLVLGDFQRAHVNYELFWEKPPLFFWLQALSMKILGVGEFAARLPNAICGIIVLPLLYRIGIDLKNRSFGLIWAGFWMVSFLPHLYHKSGIIDPWFNLFIFLSIYYLYKGHLNYASATTGSKIDTRVIWKGIIAGLFAGLALLAKGPVALLLIGGTYVIFLFWKGKTALHLIPLGLITLVSMLLSTGIWLVPEIISNGWWFPREFIAYQIRLFSTSDAGHSGFPGYHFVALLIGCFPASIYAMGAFRKNALKLDNDWKAIMLIVLALVLVVFSLVQSKIVHYSSLAYFPLTYLASISLYPIIVGRQKIPGFIKWGLGIVFGIWILGALAVATAGLDPEFIADKIDDVVLKEQIKLVSAFGWWHFLPAVLALLFILLFYRSQQQIVRAHVYLSLACILFLQFSLFVFIKPVERIVQGPALDFYESMQGKDVYVNSSFRSYAPLFYFRQPKPDSYSLESARQMAESDENEEGQNSFRKQRHSDLNWLLYDRIDKEAWFVGKHPRRKYLDSAGDVVLIEERGGYGIYRRRPKVESSE